jgi:hypothetical protein
MSKVNIDYSRPVKAKSQCQWYRVITTVYVTQNSHRNLFYKT